MFWNYVLIYSSYTKNTTEERYQLLRVAEKMQKHTFSHFRLYIWIKIISFSDHWNTRLHQVLHEFLNYTQIYWSIGLNLLGINIIPEYLMKQSEKDGNELSYFPSSFPPFSCSLDLCLSLSLSSLSSWIYTLKRSFPLITLSTVSGFLYRKDLLYPCGQAERKLKTKWQK